MGVQRAGIIEGHPAQSFFASHHPKTNLFKPRKEPRSPAPSFPTANENPPPMTRAPAIALPIVTGIMFFTKTSHTLLGAPARSPAGKRNMLATECSKPMATNIEIGSRLPAILLDKSLAEVARNTAMQTNQLHMMALTNVGPNAPVHFFTAVATASSAV